MCSLTFPLNFSDVLSWFQKWHEMFKKMDLEKLFSVVSMLSNALSGKVQTGGRGGGVLLEMEW